eukprot:m.6654 g.6654  ORF g.6654 m.6654 type:complete len:60 (-) comp3562_c0_seq1:197-376(-)
MEMIAQRKTTKRLVLPTLILMCSQEKLLSFQLKLSYNVQEHENCIVVAFVNLEQINSQV